MVISPPSPTMTVTVAAISPSSLYRTVQVASKLRSMMLPSMGWRFWSAMEMVNSSTGLADRSTSSARKETPPISSSPSFAYSVPRMVAAFSA